MLRARHCIQPMLRSITCQSTFQQIPASLPCRSPVASSQVPHIHCMIYRDILLVAEELQREDAILRDKQPGGNLYRPTTVSIATLVEQLKKV